MISSWQYPFTLPFPSTFHYVSLQDPPLLNQKAQNVSICLHQTHQNKGIPPCPSQSVKPRDSAVSGGFALLAEGCEVSDAGPAWQLHGNLPVMGWFGQPRSWLIGRHPVPNHGICTCWDPLRLCFRLGGVGLERSPSCLNPWKPDSRTWCFNSSSGATCVYGLSPCGSSKLQRKIIQPGNPLLSTKFGHQT